MLSSGEKLQSESVMGWGGGVLTQTHNFLSSYPALLQCLRFGRKLVLESEKIVLKQIDLKTATMMQWQGQVGGGGHSWVINSVPWLAEVWVSWNMMANMKTHEFTWAVLSWTFSSSVECGKFLSSSGTLWGGILWSLFWSAQPTLCLWKWQVNFSLWNKLFIGKRTNSMGHLVLRVGCFQNNPKNQQPPWSMPNEISVRLIPLCRSSSRTQHTPQKSDLILR